MLLGFYFFLLHFYFNPHSSLPVSGSPGGTSLIAVTGNVPAWSQQGLPSDSAAPVQAQTPIWGRGLGV